MIDNSIHAQNHTQKATNQHHSHIARPSSQVNSVAKENTSATIVTLTEGGKAAAKLDKTDNNSNPLSSVTMLIDKGSVRIDLDRYFSNSPPTSSGYFKYK